MAAKNKNLGIVAICATPMLVLGEDHALDEVIVLGSRYTSEISVASKVPRDMRDIPASVSVITEQRIKDQNLGTVAEAFGQVAGVSISTNEETTSGFSSRGYSMTVMHDGVPSFAAL